jgi:exopolyphosphatase/guanosine-5'-triphosphate,3'-diphosphate pyrophosphatase
MKKLHVFAAMIIGSYEITMTIYEVGSSGNMRLLNKVKQKVELGKDTLRLKKISNAKIKKLIQELLKLKMITEEYQVEEILAYGATAFREAQNRHFVLEQIKKETGIEVKVVNNPQHSLLVYKGVVSSTMFEEIAKDGAALLDASAGKLRVTIYHKGDLMLTQNVALGSMQIREWMKKTGYSKEGQSDLIREMITYRFKELDAQFLENMKIKTLVLSGDLFTSQAGWKGKKGDLLSEEEFLKLCKKGEKFLVQNMALTEDADILLPSIIICEEFFKRMNAKQVWISGMDMNDGIAYDYAVEKKYVTPRRDFNEDIYSEVIQTMNRYVADNSHNYYVENACRVIFKGLAKQFGFSKRDELILRTAALLHNCGSYITLAHAVRSSSYIVKRTEIIGLSDAERKLVSDIIRYHKMDFDEFIEAIENQELAESDAAMVGKMTVILGIANTLDAAHRQKFETIKTNVKNQEFRITVNSLSEGVLEKQFMERYQEFFEAMFGYKLILREKNQRFLTL